MAAICDICGKRPHVGNKVKRRGLAKHKGGVGQRVLGRSKRRFKPNLQRVRALVRGAPKRLRVCTQCIRSGKVVKAA